LQRNPAALPWRLQVENIVKKYGTFEAVKGVNFSVAEGEIFGLLGPNGAGKSTLIRMMTTLIPVTSGRDRRRTRRGKEPDAVRRMIGVIPQALTSDPGSDPRREPEHLRQALRRARAQRKKNIEDVLEAVDLVKWRDAQTKTLSGGMRRRLEIARGLVHNPQIFFLDEPTTGLDPVSRIAVWEMLNNLARRATSPCSSPRTTWKRRTSSATALRLWITELWWRWEHRSS
jgi:ABC-2 type transport system ATP-binding protein